jgi:dTDP-4-amino-4,6-dideoxygalactose transaminase
MRVPLLDLQSQYRSLKSELDNALLTVAERQQFILGPEGERLERSMEEFLGVGHALGVSSGTDALLLALMALGIGPDDEVIVPAFSFFATAGVVSRLNARPVFVDIDPVSFNIDPDGVRRAISERTRAIVPVHLFGQSADMDQLMAIAAEHGFPVVEDAAQEIGVQYRDGRRVGSIGRVGCFSFFPTKNLGGFGDGGLVTTDDDELYRLLRIMRVHGEVRKYHHSVVGGNFRLDELQAAVLSVKLPHLDSWSAARRRNADLYAEFFGRGGAAEGNVTLPEAIYRESGATDHHIYNQYVVRATRRDELREWLDRHEVGTAIYYPVPFHLQECFAYLGYREGELPVSERAAAEVLALPIYPELREEQIEYVVSTINEFYESHA